MRPLHFLVSILLVALTLFPAAAPLAAAQADNRASDQLSRQERAELAVHLAASSSQTDVIREAYDLLLDRYVHELNPAELLNAAYVGVARNLAEARGAEVTAAPLQLEPNRERAWRVFAEKLPALLQALPPPEGFSVSGSAIGAMARSVDEGHTGYLTPQQYTDFVAYLRGDQKYGGIGLRPRRPGVTVAEVFPNSPAEAAGLIPGDVITAVDGRPVAGKSLEEVAQEIRGPEGTPVVIQFNRPSTGEQQELTIIRASIKIEYIATDVLGQNIAYVQLRGFPEPGVADRFEAFLDTLPERQVRGLIVDLRGNSGGRVDLGIRLLNRFITQGPLFRQLRRGVPDETHMASGPGRGRWLPSASLVDGWVYLASRQESGAERRPLPVAILIDEGTASMGELFASAMREHGLARLFGRTTSGSVAAAQVFPLSDGAAVQVTVTEILSGRGVTLNRIGVSPDEVFELPPNEGADPGDPALDAAVAYIWDQSAVGPDRASAPSTAISEESRS